MNIRNWISDQFGDTDSLLDEDVYSEQEIKEDKVRLKQERKRINKEMAEYSAEYQRLLEKGAQASEIERQQYAQQAKIAKKKYKVKQQQYQKNSVQMATVVTIEGARELLDMTEQNTTNIGGLLDRDDVDLSHVQETMMNSMVEYELDMDMMMEVQDALDIDIIGADVEMGGGEEMEIMEDIEAGNLDAEQVDPQEQLGDSEDFEAELEQGLDDSLDLGPADD